MLSSDFLHFQSLPSVTTSLPDTVARLPLPLPTQSAAYSPGPAVSVVHLAADCHAPEQVCSPNTAPTPPSNVYHGARTSHRHTRTTRGRRHPPPHTTSRPPPHTASGRRHLLHHTASRPASPPPTTRHRTRNWRPSRTPWQRQRGRRPADTAACVPPARRAAAGGGGGQ